jgi:phage terminase large subunit GpA-like protein
VIGAEEYRKYLARKLAPIFRARTDRPVWEWCEEKLKLPAGEGLMGKDSPDHSLVPESKFALELVRNPNVRMIVMMYAAQSSKTFTMMEATAYMMGERKVNGVFALPSTTLQTRIYARFRAIAERSQIGMINERGKSNKEQIRFEAGNYVNWALMSSPQTMAETPADWVVADEIDENKNGDLDPIRLLTARGQTRPNFKMLIGSTPKKLQGGGGILDYYQKSKRYQIVWLCPHCNKWEHFDFETFRWPEGVDWRVIQTESLAWAECPNCGGKITDADQRNLVETQRFECLDPDLPETSIGLSKAIWHTISKSISTCVGAYLECKDEPSKLADFYNSWCARPMDLSVLTTDFEESERLTDIPRGVIPSDVVALTIGIDVGVDSIFVALIGWSSNDRKYLIWEDVCFYGGVDTFERAEQQILEITSLDRFEYVGQGQKPRVIGGAMDSGFNTRAVYDFCRRNPWCVPIKGNARLDQPWKITDADPKAQYGKSSRGVVLYSLNHGYWQDELHRSLEIKGGTSGSLSIPYDVSKRYLQHLNSEVKKRIETRNGVEYRWEKPHLHARNDLRDATIYGIFAGHRLNSHKIRLEQVAKTEPTMPKQEQNEPKSLVLAQETKAKAPLLSNQFQRLASKKIGARL